ncbi:hypothetical protein OsI_25174 [Oryza sativa Indica Group]|uniref:Uncharacterized protein n=1 Tax=Oryza sativa subsp. indica TaxID=39946 RepID=B8B7X2_ORYSI|nr:hypothetical protein OsI_25174 [Oryza sativa Indica Group]
MQRAGGVGEGGGKPVAQRGDWGRGREAAPRRHGERRAVDRRAPLGREAAQGRKAASRRHRRATGDKGERRRAGGRRRRGWSRRQRPATPLASRRQTPIVRACDGVPAPAWDGKWGGSDGAVRCRLLNPPPFAWMAPARSAVAAAAAGSTYRQRKLQRQD